MMRSVSFKIRVTSPRPQSCVVGDMGQTQCATADFLDNESDDAQLGKA